MLGDCLNNDDSDGDSDVGDKKQIMGHRMEELIMKHKTDDYNEG